MWKKRAQSQGTQGTVHHLGREAAVTNEHTRKHERGVRAESKEKKGNSTKIHTSGRQQCKDIHSGRQMMDEKREHKVVFGLTGGEKVGQSARAWEKERWRRESKPDEEDSEPERAWSANERSLKRRENVTETRESDIESKEERGWSRVSIQSTQLCTVSLAHSQHLVFLCTFSPNLSSNTRTLPALLAHTTHNASPGLRGTERESERVNKTFSIEHRTQKGMDAEPEMKR